jgi:hypothetical protein
MSFIHLLDMSDKKVISGMMVEWFKINTRNLFSDETYNLFHVYNNLQLSQLFHDIKVQNSNISDFASEFNKIDWDYIDDFYNDIKEQDIKSAYSKKFFSLGEFVKEMKIYLNDRVDKKILEDRLFEFYEKNSSMIDGFYLKNPGLNAEFDDNGSKNWFVKNIMISDFDKLPVRAIICFYRNDYLTSIESLSIGSLFYKD